jgi:hypothetical protein
MLKYITELEFIDTNVSLLFQENERIFNRKFALLNFDKSIFKIAWQSDSIEPEIIEISANIYSVGVDQNFAVINVSDGSIILKLELFYFFYSVYKLLNRIFIVTELEIIELNAITFQVLAEFGLPEIFSEMSINGSNIIEVKCMDGTVIVI